MNHRCSMLLVAASVALISVSSTFAQSPGASPTQPSSPSNPGMSPSAGTSPASMPSSTDANAGASADKSFVKKALQGGIAEVQLGQLALQKSSNPEVKQFAQKMVDDHTKLGDQMKPVAEQMGVKVPDSPSPKDKSTMTKLQALNGDAFDKAYIKNMVKDRQQDEKDFKQEAQSATNPQLKQVASQGEQVISEHLQMIQQIAQKNNVASK